MLGLGLPLPYAASLKGGGGAASADFSKTVLLLGFNGADAAVTTSDESFKARGAPTFHNASQLDTAQFKFGTASLLLDGASKISYPDSADWHSATGDWTYECWIRFSSVGGFQTIFSRCDSAGNSSIMLDAVGGTILRMRFNTTPNGMNNIQATWNYTTGVWYHVAMERAGNVYRAYADGVVITSTTLAETMVTGTLPLTIGSWATNDATGGNYVSGWIDEVRVTKGQAIYGGSFVPPTAAFPRS